MLVRYSVDVRMSSPALDDVLVMNTEYAFDEILPELIQESPPEQLHKPLFEELHWSNYTSMDDETRSMSSFRRTRNASTTSSEASYIQRTASPAPKGSVAATLSDCITPVQKRVREAKSACRLKIATDILRAKSYRRIRTKSTNKGMHPKLGL